ncbi:PIG-L family deacetylase [bacterium]|nr:PIG-L family deacetylase [bacterium]
MLEQLLRPEIQLAPSKPETPSVLIVVSHPDDEVLGVGAAGAALAEQGIPVRSCILSGNVEVRQHRPGLSDLRHDICRAQEILGFGEPVIANFPNISFNSVPHVELVRVIEAAILESGADVIFTHHPNDLNNDHLHTSMACQAAARLYQRRPGVPRLRALYFMEILSSTDWAFRNSGGGFQADTFFPIGDTLERKIEALRAYRNVMRDFPHPRSEEVVRGLAAYRGGQAGMHYAEAFQTAFHALGAWGW